MAGQLSVTGVFLGAGPSKEVGTNGFVVRSFFVDITDNPQYPNTPEFQLKGDKVALVDNLQKGQQIKVHFNLNGRRFTKTGGGEGIITNLEAWKIDVVTVQSAARVNSPAPTPAAAQPAVTQNSPVAAGGTDDLPF